MTRLDDGATRLRSGLSVWQANDARLRDAPERPAVGVYEADIAIVGAGITGAFLAEKFTREGRRVVVLDRHAPATGSTAASTAMLLWELDSSLLELESRMGLDAAARIARRCRRQVAGIGALVESSGIAADFLPRPSLYLAGDKLDAADLREEHRIRQHLGFEGLYFDEGELAARGLIGSAGLLYPGSAEVDPVKLARSLIAIAVARGARVISPTVAAVYEHTAKGVTVQTRDGNVVRVQTLVLASGYEMPDFVPAARHTLCTSWAIATPPMIAAACEPWPDGALVWEASDPYLYLRTTADGRVIIGGEDEDFSDPARRDELTPQKVATLLAKAGKRCPGLGSVEPEFIWSGVFGETEDSLPMIGRVPGRANCLVAYGYGGNGITFSAMAAQLLAAELSGEPDEDAAFYALDRD
ncbi:MAG: FAD-binding oxidoreductase [Hyphomonadaceae bacterium]|nr:FAD-binding oxidoreductase [Hyphomonadaceae bacterium]